MKTRNGFVSNSSSSSYIVEIGNTTWTEFVDNVNEAIYLDREVDSWLEKSKALLAIIEDSTERRLVGTYKDKLEAEIYDAEKLKEGDIDSIVKFLFRVHQISYHISEDTSYKNASVNLEYTSSMHNSYVSDMQDILKEIVLYFSFETDKPIKLKRIGDDSSR